MGSQLTFIFARRRIQDVELQHITTFTLLPSQIEPRLQIWHLRFDATVLFHAHQVLAPISLQYLRMHNTLTTILFHLVHDPTSIRHTVLIIT